MVVIVYKASELNQCKKMHHHSYPFLLGWSSCSSIKKLLKTESQQYQGEKWILVGFVGVAGAPIVVLPCSPIGKLLDNDLGKWVKLEGS